MDLVILGLPVESTGGNSALTQWRPAKRGEQVDICLEAFKIKQRYYKTKCVLQIKNYCQQETLYGKNIRRGLLALYLIMLIWVVLFKLRFNISSVFDHQHRSLNLIPFAAPSIINGRVNGDVLFNCLFFIPFGLLLNVNFKQVGFLPKLACILVFSLTAELIQFTFAMGVADITDLITNTFGGFLGLTLYGLSSKFMNNQKLDAVIIAIGTLLLVFFMFMRVSHVVLR